jgi:hypothetical protein
MVVINKKSAHRDRAKCCHNRDGVTTLLLTTEHTLLFASAAKISTLRRVRTPLTKGNSTPHHTVYRSTENTPQ